MKTTPAILAIASVLWAADAAAQTAPKRRPKIGVALAGGAALGLAHVGVLQWMEDNRIPIDYIAGTSIGGLVGALHATGLSSKEMRAFIADVDWQAALAPTAPYRDLSFRRKEDAAQYPGAFEIGFKKKKIGLPSGLSPGEGVALVISRFAAGYGDMPSFNDLPTPFRCVAADLASGRGVIFEKGSIFDALRSSMSMPALFAPVRMNGMVLVDGGLTNNLPVDVVKGMGADITIAVALDVPKNPNDFQSLLGVAGRSVSFMVSENERPQIAAADIVVMPLLKGMTGSDYEKWEEFRKIGYAAAEQKATMLRQFQVSEEEYRAYSQARQAKRRPATIRPQQIVVEGEVAPKLKQAVIKALTPPPGESLERDILEEQMLRLTGVGRFETATYDFRRIDGQDILRIHVRENSYGPPFLRPSIFLDGSNGDGLRFGIGARLTFLDLGGPASEWRSDLSVGTYNSLGTEYYYRVQGGKWFLAPRFAYNLDQFPLYDTRGRRLAEYNEYRYGGGGDIGWSARRTQEVRVGYELGHLKTSLATGSVLPTRLSGRYGSTRLLWRYDTRDNPLVATQGGFATGRAAWFDRYPNVNRDFAMFEHCCPR